MSRSMQPIETTTDAAPKSKSGVISTSTLLQAVFPFRNCKAVLNG